MKEWQKGSVDLGGAAMCYHRTGGDLPPLVLAHGITDNGLCWSRVARELENDFDIIMLDARGHGESARIVIGADYDLARDVVDVMDALGLDEPAVMGHSMGARTMTLVANGFPGRVSKVVLEDPPFFEQKPDPVSREARAKGFREQVEAFTSMTTEDIAKAGRKQSPGWHEDELEAWALSKKQADANVMAGMKLADTWQETIRNIVAPTLLIYGDRGKGGIVSEAIANEACAINPNFSALHLAGAGHNIRREKFDEFVVAVRAFLV